MSVQHSARVGYFLAKRLVLRSNKYVSGLIIFILMLIFLNLVAMSGLLSGMIESSNIGYYTNYGGSIIVKPLLEKNKIQKADELITFAKSLPGFLGYSPRITTSGRLELDWLGKKKGSLGNSSGASIIGLDPELENQTTGLSQKMVAGRFLLPEDRDSIILGANLAGLGESFAVGETLQNVELGEKVLVHYSNGFSKEYTIVGFYRVKLGLLDFSAMVTLKELQNVLQVDGPLYDEISIKTIDPVHPEGFKQYFINAGYNNLNRIETWKESMGSAIEDVNTAFTLIGDIIGGIGLMVGGITIFILIFVNAVSKRKFIGILKASGVNAMAIVLAYIFQALAYTIIAIILGVTVLFGLIDPYITANPIDFPFSDTVLYLPAENVQARITILFIVSFLAGLVPAYLITRQNTLDTILGR